MGWFSSISSLLGGGLEAFNRLMSMKERKQDRTAGQNEMLLDGHERVEDSREKMDDVPRPGRGDTADRLRDGSF